MTAKRDFRVGRGILAAAAVLLLASAGSSSAVVLTGSLGSTIYAQKSRVGANPFIVRDQLYHRNTVLGSARLDVLQLGPPELSFHTGFSGSNVITDESARDTHWRLYRAFLQWANRSGRLRYDARVGRQWVLAGVGTGVVDGVSLQLSRSRWGDLSGYFGTLGTDRLTHTKRFWSLDKPSESRSFGGRARFSRPLGVITPTLAASYMQASRKPHEKLVTDAQRAGLNAELRLTRGRTGHEFLEHLRLWGEARRDMFYGRQIGLTGGLEYREGPAGLHGWFEYNQRRPRLGLTDLFSSFDTRTVRQYRAGVGRQVYKGITLDLTGDVIAFEGGDQENGGEILVSGYGCTAGYRLHGGYGGDLSGLVLYGHRDVGERISLDASVNWAQYSYGEVQGVEGSRIEDHEAAGILAVGYRLLPQLTLTGQVEGLQNANLKQDVRFLGMVNWRFRAAL